MKQVLALDLATRTGWAFRNFEGAIDSGVTLFLGTLHPGDRWIRFENWLASWTEKKPELLIYEAPFIHPEHRSGWGVAYGFTTLVQLVAARYEIPLRCVTPAELKQFATGHGNASKTLMRTYARVELGFEGADDNEIDARYLLHYAAKVILKKERAA